MIRMKRPTLKQNKEAVVRWNKKHPPGTKVRVRKDDGSEIDSQTHSEAHLLGGHTPVVWLEGIAGAYALERCTPI